MSRLWHTNWEENNREAYFCNSRVLRYGRNDSSGHFGADGHRACFGHGHDRPGAGASRRGGENRSGAAASGDVEGYGSGSVRSNLQDHGGGFWGGGQGAVGQVGAGRFF